jgi:hypothetical protein
MSCAESIHCATDSEHPLALWALAPAACLHLARLRMAHSFSLRLANFVVSARLAGGEAAAANAQDVPGAASARARRARGPGLASSRAERARLDPPREGGWLTRSSRAQDSCDRRQLAHVPRGRG